MPTQIFRYVVVLLAVIVVLRILLSISAGKKQENNSQPGEAAFEMEDKVEQVNPLEDGEPAEEIKQVLEASDQESDHE